jgi:UDP-glucose 4-epimerase
MAQHSVAISTKDPQHDARVNILGLTNDFFCIGTGQPTSVNEIYQTLAHMTGFQAPITKAPKRPGDIYLSYFNCSMAEQILGWKPEVTFEEGVKATVEFFKMTEPDVISPSRR